MKAKMMFLALGLCLIAAPGYGQPAPTWENFSIKSGNGNFVAEVQALKRDKGAVARNLKYTLSVFDLTQKTRQPLWSCDYDYDGYPQGILSDNGAAFIYICPWYASDQALVKVYYKGRKTGAILGKEFELDAKENKAWLAQKKWLAPQKDFYRFIAFQDVPLVIEIMTVDSHKHLIQIQNGKMPPGEKHEAKK